MRAAALSLTALALGIFPLAAPAHADCAAGDGALKLEAPDGAPFAVTVKTRPGTVAVGEPFAADIAVCGKEGAKAERIAVDATMPAHNHGMNYVPEVKDLGGGRYAAEGLLFHMPGTWRVEVSVYADGKPHRLSRDVAVE